MISDVEIEQEILSIQHGNSQLRGDSFYLDALKELLALRKAFSEPVGTIEATCDYVTDVDWLQDIDSGEYLVIRKPADSIT